MTQIRLTLVSHALCPFVQRAAIVLLEKDIPFERITVDLDRKPDWFLALSPLGKVPLQDEAGTTVLFESMVICEHLEESQPGTPLHPAGVLARARHRAWIEFVSSTLTDAWAYLNARDKDTAGSKANAFRDKLERLEAELDAGPFFAGSAFSLVNAVAAPVFRYFNILAPVTDGLFVDLPRVFCWRRALI